MTSVLNLATDPVDGYKLSVVLLISPEQGDSGEVSGKQRRFEQQTLLDQFPGVVPFPIHSSQPLAPVTLSHFYRQESRF